MVRNCNFERLRGTKLQYQAIYISDEIIIVADGKNDEKQERGGYDETIYRIGSNFTFNLHPATEFRPGGKKIRGKTG
jgi:hypothetical protein